MLQKGIKGRLQRSICAGEVCNTDTGATIENIHHRCRGRYAPARSVTVV